MLRKKGFTLVELLVVVLILGALAAIAVPRIIGGAQSAKANACNTNVDLINSQIELYYSNNGTWPATLAAVVGTAEAPTEYFPDGPPECPFGTPYVLGDNHRVAAHSH
jgi:general secretion pathway protein G